MTKGELIKFLEPFDDDINSDNYIDDGSEDWLRAEYVSSGYGRDGQYAAVRLCSGNFSPVVVNINPKALT